MDLTTPANQFGPLRDQARMVELADTPDLGSGAERCKGSSPFPGTIANQRSCR